MPVLYCKIFEHGTFITLDRDKAFQTDAGIVIRVQGWSDPTLRGCDKDGLLMQLSMIGYLTGIDVCHWTRRRREISLE